MSKSKSKEGEEGGIKTFFHIPNVFPFNRSALRLMHLFFAGRTFLGPQTGQGREEPEEQGPQVVQHVHREREGRVPERLPHIPGRLRGRSRVRRGQCVNVRKVKLSDPWLLFLPLDSI